MVKTNLWQSWNFSNDEINVGVSELHLQTDSNNEFARQIGCVNKYHKLGIPLQKVVAEKVIFVLKQFLTCILKYSLTEIKVLEIKAEIKVLEKGLDFAAI